MKPITTLVSTWSDGLFVLAGEHRHQEFAGQPVRALASDGRGGALAIVNGHSLKYRTPDGVWSTIADTEFDLACCVASGDVVYAGTDDARVLRISAGGDVVELHSFHEVPGRNKWYSGQALVDGLYTSTRFSHQRLHL